MTLIDQILRLSDRYCGALGIERTTLSWRLFGDSKKLDALYAGADLQTRRFEAALAWLDRAWPAAAEWPAAIPRASALPSPTWPEATTKTDVAADPHPPSAPEQGAGL